MRRKLHLAAGGFTRRGSEVGGAAEVGLGKPSPADRLELLESVVMQIQMTSSWRVCVELIFSSGSGLDGSSARHISVLRRLVRSTHYLLAAYFLLFTTHCLLLTTHYLLLVTYYSLLTTCYLLLTTHS